MKSLHALTVLKEYTIYEDSSSLLRSALPSQRARVSEPVASHVDHISGTMASDAMTPHW